MSIAGKASALIDRLGRDLVVQRATETGRDKYNRPEYTWAAIFSVRGNVQEGEPREIQTPAGERVIVTHEIYTDYREDLLEEGLRILDGTRIYNLRSVGDDAGLRDHMFIRASQGGYIRE